MNIFKFFLFISFLFSSSYTVLAQTKISSLEQIIGRDLAKNVRDCFQESYNNSKIYRKGWCHQNTKDLHHKCFQPLKLDGKVIYLMRTNNASEFARDRANGQVYPLMSRANVDRWDFHVFYEFEGHVFDLDYTSKPEITDILTYFKKMFDYKSGKHQYVIRVIPANDYAMNYNDYLYNWNYYLANREGSYPLKDVVEYLNSYR